MIHVHVAQEKIYEGFPLYNHKSCLRESRLLLDCTPWFHGTKGEKMVMVFKRKRYSRVLYIYLCGL